MPSSFERTRRFWRDLSLFALSFAVLFAVGVVAWPALDASDAALQSAWALAGVTFAFIALMFWRRLWHAFANRFFVGAPMRVVDPWVIDGDTIDDRASEIRYRLANIDAPETDAKCYREATRGQLAKWALVRMVRTANTVVVRPTFRKDRYGRRVAFLLIDGRDAGCALVERGLAVPWTGSRRRWCGPNGGLANIAKAGAMAHSCKACRALR